ncbi:MAG: serine/threonine-protein kinase [Polyangiaceae bacterium]
MLCGEKTDMLAGLEQPSLLAMRASARDPQTTPPARTGGADVGGAGANGDGDPAREGAVLAGKYRVERVLGRGGMGVVVAARHLQLGERVAVKLMLPRMAERPGAAARFVREGRAAARIRNEHVARVLDAGTLEGGERFLVIEYLRGRDLRAEVLATGPLSVEDAVSYVLHACEGLAEAHAHGIVHRDLKPANLFLTRRADGGKVVKIIDFGVSKLACPETGDLTESDVAIGTPHYMAPEQMRAARDVDQRADIFSLGAVLYWLLTGTLPFPGDSMVAVYDQQREGPPSMSARGRAVPAEIAAIVDRCLRMEPRDRFGDVGSLAVALAPFAAPWARPAAERARRITEERPPVSLTDPTEPHGDLSISPFETTELVEGSAPVETELGREPTWLREGDEEASPSDGASAKNASSSGGTATENASPPSFERHEEASPQGEREPRSPAPGRRGRVAFAVGVAVVAALAATGLFAMRSGGEADAGGAATASIGATSAGVASSAGEPAGAAGSGRAEEATGAGSDVDSGAGGSAAGAGGSAASAGGSGEAGGERRGGGTGATRVHATRTGAQAPPLNTTTTRTTTWAPGPMDTPD